MESGHWRIGVVDDHEPVLEGLRSFLAATPDLRLCAAAATVGDLLAASGTDLDLVVLDLRLDDGSTPVQNVAALTAAGLNVLVYTSGEEPYLVRQAAAAGVLGVIRKTATREVLCEAIRTAAAGTPVVSMDWAAALDSDPTFVDLPERLRQVLELYAAGESAQRVGHELFLSPETIADYVDRIRQRYREAHRDAPTKTDLYKRAVEDGWLPMPRRDDG